MGKVRLWEIVPRLGISATDPLFGDSWYRGNVEFLYEGAFIWNTEPNSGFAAGAGTTLRYNFLKHERVVPFLDANFGIVNLDFDLDLQSDGFNFNVGFGTGAHWFVSRDTAISTEVRWQHISNKNTQFPNNGINAALFLLGVSYFPPW
ncbi:MAG: acyloxyacyl hydrolase [Pseudomonadota bacterium]|nr:acyloxyacyl hydrolase [Pseudomonadota bacterium]